MIPAEQFSVEQVKPLTLSDLALDAMVTLDKRTVAAVLGIPAFVLGVGEFDRDAWNNFINTTIMPLARGIEQELTKKLLLSPEWFFRFNNWSLFSYSITELVSAGAEMVDRMALRRNEWRGWVNLPPDPEMNQTLKKVIERAKANNVPADVIKRAIEKAKSNDTENYSSARYEGFGSGGGSSIIIDCLTDNPNRTIANLRACFNKAHAKLGVGGSVSFNYEHTGLIVIDYDDEEAMMDALIMAEVDLKDIEVEDGVMTITVEPSDLSKTKEAVEQLIPDVEFKVMEDTMLPNDYVELEGEDLELFKRLVTLLDDVDDVQNVYHNVKNINA